MDSRAGKEEMAIDREWLTAGVEEMTSSIEQDVVVTSEIEHHAW